MRKSLVSGILVGFLVLSTGIAHAANKKFVLQISDGGAKKQTLVLNVANNLEKHYGVGNVDVEIVAFGPGLRLLFADNARKGRIQSLNMNGVRFSACSNTMHKMTSILGHPPELNPRAKVVPGGVVRIADLVSQGYILIRP
jgi:intracellular sulfur oxidation DsrE/DsrF family protein